MRVIGICMPIGSFWGISVIEIKRCLTSAGLLGIVVSEFKRREKHFPVLVLEYKRSYRLLYDFNSCFRLSICLRMFCCRHEKFYSQNLIQILPKLALNLFTMT